MIETDVPLERSRRAGDDRSEAYTAAELLGEPRLGEEAIPSRGSGPPGPEAGVPYEVSRTALSSRADR